MRTKRTQSIVARYALAVASVCAALVFTHLLRGIGDSGISPLFFAAVLLTAWYGGLGPGLTATLLSGIATAYLLVKDHGGSFASMRDVILRLVVFSIISLITSSLHGAMKRAAEASQEAKEAAETANAAKSHFLAMVSHELRTPLSPVLMISEMLENDPSLPPALREDVRSIRRHVDLEIRLIEDLVDLTRISAGKLHLREVVVNVCEPLKAAVDVCKDDLREKQLELKAEFSAAQSHIVGDPVRLQQVFWNLIRNAVKFTPEGGRISISTSNPDPGTIRIDIADSGIGIDPQRLACIFNAFEQGEADTHVRFGGLGLGLAICEALVEGHKGTINAASEGRDRGATFSVTFPVAREVAGQVKEQADSMRT